MSRKQVIFRIIIILIISLILAVVFFFGLKLIKVIKILNLWIAILKNTIFKIKSKQETLYSAKKECIINKLFIKTNPM